MCLCLLIYKRTPSWPVLVAANREEAYDRPADGPAWLADDPLVFAGRDRRAGGTWLGVNGQGLLVALTNRRGGFHEPACPSRGLLCLSALRCPSAVAAADWLQRHLAGACYNPCNLVCADVRDAFAVHYDGALVRRVPLGAGLHLLADTDVDEAAHPRLQRARGLLRGSVGQSWPAVRRTLERTMGAHVPGLPAASICVHAPRAGTVSSSIIGLRGTTLEGSTYLHAPGPPCTHAYEDLSSRLRTPRPQTS
ncbi:MAG: NRDE family protein [Candidatus Latescibacterota bacterium]